MTREEYNALRREFPQFKMRRWDRLSDGFRWAMSQTTRERAIAIEAEWLLVHGPKQKPKL